jgi:hypothetical protein
MNHKTFAERLNRALDEIDAPTLSSERIDVLSKLTKTAHFKAAALLGGTMMPDPALLRLLAQEFEVSENWLLGKED